MDMSRTKALCLWVSFGLLLGGCGGALSSTERPGNADLDLRAHYPAAPYGVEEGMVLEDHSFVAPDTLPFALSDIHQDGSKRLLLLNASAQWCQACIEEQPLLEQLYQAYRAKGLVVVVALFQDQYTKPADAALAADWKSRYGLSFDVVADPDFALSAYYDATLTPMNMFVDLDTMQIVKVVTGVDKALVESLVDAML